MFISFFNILNKNLRSGLSARGGIAVQEFNADAIAHLQGIEKCLELLQPLLGGQQNDEVEDREHERDRYQLDERIDARARRRSHGERQVVQTDMHKE